MRFRNPPESMSFYDSSTRNSFFTPHVLMDCIASHVQQHIANASFQHSKNHLRNIIVDNDNTSPSFSERRKEKDQTQNFHWIKTRSNVFSLFVIMTSTKY